MKVIEKTILIIFLVSVCIVSGYAVDAEKEDKKVVAEPMTLYFFYGKGCPVCKTIMPGVEALPKEFPGLTVKTFEVWFNEENRDMLIQMARQRHTAARGVPTVVIGTKVYLGDSMAVIRKLVREHIQRIKSKPEQKD